VGRDEFWDFSPRELAREFEAAKLRRQDEFDRDMVQAWHVEMLHRQKKVPPLESLLRAKRAARAPTRDQQLAVMHILSAQMGIPLRKVSRRG